MASIYQAIYANDQTTRNSNILVGDFILSESKEGKLQRVQTHLLN